MIQPIIDQLGREGTVHKLVNCFYDIIEKRPEGSHILSLHQDGHGLHHARLEQFNVMCGFLGGRNYYYEKHGHMNVKLMHEHIPIRLQDAEAWLTCMDMALENCDLSGPAVARIQATFRKVALSLVNVQA